MILTCVGSSVRRIGCHSGGSFTTTIPDPLFVSVRWCFQSTTTAVPVALNVDRLSVNDGDTTSRILFLHGLLGHGRNLKTFAKQVCTAQNSNGLLMDLRGHGKSRISGSNTLTTFADCVRDIQHTVETTDGTSISTVVGHSWGGRMAVQFAYEEQQQKATSSIKQVWLLDVVPGQANESVERVVGIVDKLQDAAIESKKDLLKRLTKDEGLDMATSQWLASSYQGPGDFGFDLSVVQDILPEFASQDLEGMMAELLRAGVEVDLVRGGKNTAWDIPTLNRLEQLKRDHPGTFGLHVLPKAGHWVHVDDLKGLVGLLGGK